MKKLLSAALAVLLVMSMLLPSCFADEVTASGGTGSVPVTLTAEAATFKVTVPTVLPISVAANGTVTTADSATITNLSHGAVRVTGLAVEGASGWTTAGYETFDTAAENVGSKNIGLAIGGEKTTGSNSVSFSAANWTRMTGADASSALDELTFTYDAKVAPQASAVSGTTVASVIFTIGWDFAS